MKHVVLKPFRDKEDCNAKDEARLYLENDKFPATKRKVSDERLEELQKMGYIVEKE